LRHGPVHNGGRYSRTVFLDRDGVINRHRPGDYVKTWEEFEFLPGACEALRLLTARRVRVVIVTNQRGIARGLFSEEALRAVHQRMLDVVTQSGAAVAGIYFCPHDEGQCECRKPRVGLFLEAQRDFPDIDFSTSLVIGDSESDMQAGAKLGCATVLVGRSATYPSASSLLEAVHRYVAAPDFGRSPSGAPVT
jgi:D-glycero-D-manno-heptose 1,7-bisphosphate phosphatase